MKEVCSALEKLVSFYKFPLPLLSGYLQMKEEVLLEVAGGNWDMLPQDAKKRHEIEDRILFLACIPEGHPDRRVSAFLNVLLSYHQIPAQAIADMAGVSKKTIEDMARDGKIVLEDKYKIAATVMALRFFLKDMESA